MISRDVELVLDKYIILLVDADDTPVSGIYTLQKIMFLLSNKVKDVKYQSMFELGNSGPYSSMISGELKGLPYSN